MDLELYLEGKSTFFVGFTWEKLLKLLRQKLFLDFCFWNYGFRYIKHCIVFCWNAYVFGCQKSNPLFCPFCEFVWVLEVILILCISEMHGIVENHEMNEILEIRKSLEIFDNLEIFENL